MRKQLRHPLYIIIYIMCAVFLLNILSCTLLCFFEPVNYNEPDLTKLNYTFELYEKFAYEKDNQFYIKQITADNVASHEDDNRLKYIVDTVLLFVENGVTYTQAEALISEHNGSICGYIADINFYQVEFDNYNYTELMNVCSTLQDNDLVEITMIDYFEETPPSSVISEETTDDYLYDTQLNDSYLEQIHYPDISEYADAVENVRVGIIDALVDNNGYFDIINSETYNDDWKTDPQTLGSNSHGTHVAGIFAAKATSDAPAICPGADIVSEHALNNSISYWIAAIADMVLRYEVKVINMSMGYNSFITIGASLGSEKEINFVKHEADFFEAFIRNLKGNNKEFVMCFAAGNSQDEQINIACSPVFKYGKKKLLNSIDVFDIYTRTPDFCDAKYSLPFSFIDDIDVKNNIIVVGSINNMGYYSSFSNRGTRVDIAAPGENVYSFGLNGEYEYMSGTSMACPFVSGAAALMFAVNPNLTAKEAKEILINSSTEQVKFTTKFTYPVLNIEAAVENAINAK